MGASTEGGWTYSRSGVDRGAVAGSLARLLAQVHGSSVPSHGRPVHLPGHYAGLIRIGRETIAITTDTIGTKGLLAEEVGAWEGVGEDIVAVNVNDLASVGARPSALVDTISVAKPSPEVFEQIGRGLDRGLRTAGITLLGGETAVVPELVHGYDLGGTAIGFFPRGRRPVTGSGIRPGDIVLGVPSSGVHANGLTLVRRLLREHRIDLAAPRPGGPGPVGLELLNPTRIYSPVSEAVADRPEVQGFAHISGGGVRNLARLSGRVAFVLDHWPVVPSLFRWIQELGAVASNEMFQTFNMGIGFAIVSRPRRLSETLRRLARAGAADALVIGHVERGRGVRLPDHDLAYPAY
ncbi:MAG: phosphoribosylformylglycinamidine cyclo-ligase [Thermoplasmata archaeon]|nr:phosphoribosylformylglycinamidine cyclo-ligase [Thermoplasmata archaeon]MCI4359223.1 phosphoribosylformylglycinamidine cyclo-ligase [Thermoplasmata archaeon]